MESVGDFFGYAVLPVGFNHLVVHHTNAVGGQQVCLRRRVGNVNDSGRQLRMRAATAHIAPLVFNQCRQRFVQ